MMRRAGLPALLLAAGAAVGSLVGCAAPFPDSPSEAAANFPAGGIPTQVLWPSDWLEGIAGESEAIGGRIVGLGLEYRDDTWVWRVTSTDPEMDWTGEQVADPLRGREALLDAETLTPLQQRHVSLPESAAVHIDVGTAEAARLSGEIYPDPRLIALELTEESGEPHWEATMMRMETGRIFERSIPALGEGELIPPAKP